MSTYAGFAGKSNTDKKRRSKKDGKMKYPNSKQTLSSNDKKLDIHSVEKLLIEAESIRAAYSPKEPQVTFFWEEYTKGHTRTILSSHAVEIELRKVHGFWQCSLKIAGIVLLGKGKSRQSALWTTWNTYAAEISRCYYQIPHKLDWGNIDEFVVENYVSDKPAHVPDKFVRTPVTQIASSMVLRADSQFHAPPPVQEKRGFGLTKAESELPLAEREKILAARKLEWLKTA